MVNYVCRGDFQLCCYIGYQNLILNLLVIIAVWLVPVETDTMHFDLTSSDPLSVNTDTSSTIPLTFVNTPWDCLRGNINEAPPISGLKAPPLLKEAPNRPPSDLAEALRVWRFERITELVVTSFIKLKMTGLSSLSVRGQPSSMLGMWLDGGRWLSFGAWEVKEGEGGDAGSCFDCSSSLSLSLEGS